MKLKIKEWILKNCNWVMWIVVGICLVTIIMVQCDEKFPHTVKFMKIWREFPLQELTPEPEDDFAWGEDIPEFILKRMPIATTLRFDGIEYPYGENKIRIEEEWFTTDKLEILVNDNIGWSLSNFSIYSSGEDIAIYGYWNDEFRRIRVGKTKDDIKFEVLTPNSEIPFSAHAVYATETENEYWLSFSEDGRVSAYKDKQRIGDSIQLKETFFGMYTGATFCDETGNFYMPYIVNNNGKREFICPKVATLDITEFEIFIDWEIRVRDCLIISNSVFPTFKENGNVIALVPNELEKFIQYENGEAELSVDDDLGWHYVEIE